MNALPLHNIVEPTHLLLTWQPVDGGPWDRRRRIVGRVRPGKTWDEMWFRYLSETSDFAAARLAGFTGFPAFELGPGEMRLGVHDALMRRLPPRKREDFPEFLARHRLPWPFPYSDLALLGYTGARLPSDGFALVPEFSPDLTAGDRTFEAVDAGHASGSVVMASQRQ